MYFIYEALFKMRLRYVIPQRSETSVARVHHANLIMVSQNSSPLGLECMLYDNLSLLILLQTRVYTSINLKVTADNKVWLCAFFFSFPTIFSKVCFSHGCFTWYSILCNLSLDLYSTQKPLVSTLDLK